MHTAMHGYCKGGLGQVPYKLVYMYTGCKYRFNCTLHDQCLWFQSEIEDFFISTRYRQFQDRQILYIAMHVVLARMIY